MFYSINDFVSYIGFKVFLNALHIFFFKYVHNVQFKFLLMAHGHYYKCQSSCNVAIMSIIIEPNISAGVGIWYIC